MLKISVKTPPEKIKQIKKGDVITDGNVSGSVMRVSAFVKGNKTYFEFKVKIKPYGSTLIYFTL